MFVIQGVAALALNRFHDRRETAEEPLGRLHRLRTKRPGRPAGHRQEQPGLFHIVTSSCVAAR